MSLLGNTKSKVKNIREITNPFKIMGVDYIIIDDDFHTIFNTIDSEKLVTKIKLSKSDDIPVVGGYNVYNKDVYMCLAHYICRHFIGNPDTYKLQYDDIMLNGVSYIPILISPTFDEELIPTLYVYNPNGSRMTIKYKQIKYE